MAERTLTANRWLYGLAYAGVMAALLLVLILPVSPDPGPLPGPDLMLAITTVWVLRRPAYVPAPLIAAVFLAADMLLMRPPGLWAALVVLATEFLRRRSARVRTQSFGLEWALSATTILAVAAAYWLVLSLALAGRPPLGLLLLQALATVLVLPLVVLVSRWVFGLGRVVPGEYEARGPRK